MNTEDLRRTIPDATPVGIAVLKNYRLSFSAYSYSRGGGVVDIVQSKGSWVEGVLYELSAEDLKWLDAREGAPKTKWLTDLGHYVRGGKKVGCRVATIERLCIDHLGGCEGIVARLSEAT